MEPLESLSNPNRINIKDLVFDDRALIKEGQLQALVDRVFENSTRAVSALAKCISPSTKFQSLCIGAEGGNMDYLFIEFNNSILNKYTNNLCDRALELHIKENSVAVNQVKTALIIQEGCILDSTFDKRDYELIEFDYERKRFIEPHAIVKWLIEVTDPLEIKREDRPMPILRRI